MSSNVKELVDRGFDSDFSSSRINEFCGLFSDEDVIQNYVNKIHEEDNSVDMKRGEFYPEILRGISSLKRAAANAYGIEPVQCHPNFGSNGSIDTILMAMKIREINSNIDTVKYGGVLDVDPTYFRNYNSSASKKLRMTRIPLQLPGWTFDLDNFIKAINTFYPTVVFLVTPNNPTGIAIPDEAILKVIDEVPEKTLVVMDRTLVNISSEINTVELLRKYKSKQLVILHSFSKYVGMSHMRIGIALYSNADIANEIRPLLPLGLGVEASLKATRYLLNGGPLKPSKRIIENITKSKEILNEFCQISGMFSCTDFIANYCLLILPQHLTTEKVVNELEKHGIYTMGGEEFPEPKGGIVRLHTGGNPKYMKKTVDVLNYLYTK